MRTLKDTTAPRGATSRRRLGATAGALLALAFGATALPMAGHSLGSDEVSAPPSGQFSDLSTSDLWGILHQRGDRAVVGLKDDHETHGFAKGQILVDPAERAEAEASIQTLSGVRLMSADDLLPTITVEVDNAGAVAALRASNYVDFVEPASFPGKVMSSGCTGNDWNADPEGGNVVSGDILDSTAAGDRVPRNFQSSHIQDAWGRSQGGAGVTVGVMDTGIFDTQMQLRPASVGGRFDVGLSSGRTIQYFDESETGQTFDTCNHGTRSAGTIAGPLDGQGLAGVAYRANVVAAKVNEDVFIDAWETDDLVRGIRRAVDNGARVVSIAMGTGSWEYQNITQEIQYDYYNRGVLFVAAAGTTYCLEGVIYPAKLPEVVAVTGTVADGHRHPEACGGPEVDIAAVISGAAAPGRRPQDIIDFGGSSAATGLVAGTAAVIWSTYPWMSRDQVRDRLIWAGQGAVESGLGNGVVDAYKAVGGLYALNISGPTRVTAGSTYSLTALPQGDGPYNYQWHNGATSQSITATAGAAGTTQTFTVWVQDTVDGRWHTTSITVTSVRPTPPPPDPCTNRRVCN